MNIIKIGGILLSDYNNYFKLKELINSFDKPVFLIISAIGKTTRSLQETCFLAYNGEYDSALEKLEQIKNIHFGIINKIFNKQTEVLVEIKDIFVQIERYVEGIYIVRELNKKILDKVLSIGEILSATIVRRFLLCENIPVNYLKAFDYIITDDNFGSACPLFQETAERLNELKLRPEIYLIEGFYGKNKKNEITTMGFESSNLTATLVASILGIKTIYVISDVNCIFSADPKIISNSLPISKINTQTAKLLAKISVKLIYDGMIEYIEQTDSQLIFTSLDNSQKTLISKNVINDNLPILSFGETTKLKNSAFSIPSLENDFYISFVNIDYTILIKLQNFFIERCIDFSMYYNEKQKFAIFTMQKALNNDLICEIHSLITT